MFVRPANDTSTYRLINSSHLGCLFQEPVFRPVPFREPVLILQPGFQMRLEYQSPNGQWYPYSFLQGNNETTTTIGNTNPPVQRTCVFDKFSNYGQPALYTNPTVVNSGTATLWSDVTGALAHAPMFASPIRGAFATTALLALFNIAKSPMTFIPRALWNRSGRVHLHATANDAI